MICGQPWRAKLRLAPWAQLSPAAALHVREAGLVEGGRVLVGEGEDRVIVQMLLGRRSWRGQGLRLKQSVGTEWDTCLLSSGKLSDMPSG